MARLTILLMVVVLVVVLALVGVGAYLAFGNFPAPVTPIEKVLPDARFPK